jgi:biopolymer transport protein ExbD
MAQKRRFLDVWIIESNTVYREVPFPVVTDWIQQGRLLEDDRLRPSGTAEWFRVGGMSEFSPYLPRAEPFRADDQAEALEPVELDFRWHKRQFDEDEDVDMIPLIDVSLVLLIFFMLTGSGVAAMFVQTPRAEYGQLAGDQQIVLEIDLIDQVPVYNLRVGSSPPEPGEAQLKDDDALMARLRQRLEKPGDSVDVSINAHPDLRAGVVRRLLAKVEAATDLRGRIRKKYLGVSESRAP